VRTVLPIHRNVSIGGAVLVVAEYEITLWWNDKSDWNFNGSGLKIFKGGYIVLCEAEETIGEIEWFISTIVELEPRALVLADGGIDHELGNDNDGRLS
jgi:hypothetical protein